VPELGDSELLRLLEALADTIVWDLRVGPAGRRETELQSLSITVLRRAAACWERGTSLATSTLLAQWCALENLVPRSMPIPAARIWHAPPGSRDIAQLDDDPIAPAAPLPSTEHSIVARILADL
jgi:hypothetical protein